MKKVIRCLGMMALMALAFTSCKKTDQQSTFKATIPALTIADIQDDEDRAYIQITGNSAQPMFELNDRAMIFNISETNPEMSHCASYKTLGAGTSVEFVDAGTGTVGAALDGGYYLYYPSFIVPDVNNPEYDPEEPIYVLDRLETELEGVGDEGPANKSKFYVSPVQKYRADKVARHDLYMAAHLTQEQAPTLDDDNANFMFTPICGVLQLHAYEAAQRTVTKIEIVDNTMSLSGWVELIIPAVGNPNELKALCNHLKTDPTNETYLAQLNQFRANAEVNITETGHSVTLDIPGGVQLGPNSSNPAIFNIVLRPLALMNGFHIILTFDDESTKDCDLTSKNWVISPNELQRRLFNVDKY